MTAHKHAALMAEYAKDALETDKPWERWEYSNRGIFWTKCPHSPNWGTEVQYRRKRIPLCQVEGKDVFAGDRLWHDGKQFVVASMGSGAGWNTWLKDVGGVLHAPDAVSWTEPPRTKIVYQWAVKDTEGGWHLVTMYYPDEDSLRQKVILRRYPEAKRLDYTALEVPND